MAFNFPVPPELDDPILGFRFAVVFMGKTGPSHLLDFRFQSVKGLGLEVQIGGGSGESGESGRKYPQSMRQDLLELERGLPVVSTLRQEISKSFRDFQFKPRNVMVSLLNEAAIPVSTWLYQEAYPVQWSLSDWDANSNQVVIESLKLTYTQVKPFSL